MIAPPVSAQKPPTGLSLVIFVPMVLTMRQPPNIVPRAIAVLAGQDDPERQRIGLWPIVEPAAISSIQMMPMVFCASLPPWPEAVERGGDELQPAKPADRRAAASAPENSQDTAIISRPAENQAQQRRQQMNSRGL